ncbi:type II toxin-antitoxin system YhaV family toxin [Thalassotalea agarivorans]|nr:type II toxin-antitoxin system YhaV family toxin [Thalassotalea agarivorans]
MLVINGWTIYAHPFFLDQLEELIQKVESLKAKDPKGYKKKNATKRLAAINKLAFENIPQDPTMDKYRQGDTLGGEYKHWFRDKFYQQYRLFFRYHKEAKIIIYAWVNDDKTLRAYDSKTDAYKVFAGMLDDGNPPDDWDELLKAAKKEQARLDKAIKKEG